MITRNTRRADGLTVGQAIDRDAAYLRSIGIPAKDGAATHDERREDFTDEIRAAVLAALDSVLLSRGLTERDAGALDRDLPVLFEGLDAHAETLWNRHLFAKDFDPRTREERA